jgi:hypothetical protein
MLIPIHCSVLGVIVNRILTKSSRWTVLALMLAIAAVGARADGNLKPEEVIQKHLDSIGTAEARAGVKSRVVEGTTVYKVLVGGSGEIQGNTVMVSEARNLQLMLKINAIKYHGEKFMRNGDKTFIAGTYDDHSRSEFGEFLLGDSYPLREGLLGGVWSTGWPLLDADAVKGKLHYAGLKKVEGRELHAVEYHGKKSSDLEVTLYFEPETFRHVMTLYTARRHAGIGAGGDLDSPKQNETRYRIEERFSDFKTQDGLTLPTHYDLRFQQELKTGFTKLVDWDTTSSRVLNNVSLDPKNFEIH